MVNVLVTGGAGYIGSHACKALAEAGYTPIAYDNLSFGHRGAVKWGPFEEGDILDSARLERVFTQHKPRVVMHFAALTYVGESVTDPAKFYRNNVVGALELLEAMRRHDANIFILSSTCATYGDVATLPITEDAPQAPINPYGYTKLIIEQALKDYERAYGLRWAAMRYFNAAGADADGEIGESHTPETHAIPLAIFAAMGKTAPFKVFGTDYPTPDGTALRDYVHVSDLADAHVRAIEFLDKGGASGAFNLATGAPTSVLELIAAVERATGLPVPRTLAPRRPGDAVSLYATGEKARRVLGWTPRYDRIEPIVATAARWHADQKF
jgi:UDP-glucose-4-epimerase GalE